MARTRKYTVIPDDASAHFIPPRCRICSLHRLPCLLVEERVEDGVVFSSVCLDCAQEIAQAILYQP